MNDVFGKLILIIMSIILAFLVGLWIMIYGWGLEIKSLTVIVFGWIFHGLISVVMDYIVKSV